MTCLMSPQRTACGGRPCLAAPPARGPAAFAAASSHIQDPVRPSLTRNLPHICRRELLRGPLYYVLILVAVTLIYWRESPVGFLVVALMCGGDGMADIVGRRFGRSAKLPHNNNKSWAGSTAMFAGQGLSQVILS